MDYEEYKKLRKQILEDCDKELAALDMVWKRLQKINSPSINQDVEKNGGGNRAPVSAGNIRTVIKGFSQNFSADDVQDALIAHGYVEKGKVNRVGITNALHRLYRRDEIQVITKGKGRMGAIYKNRAA